jgi:tetratricopeptide (TPR) repeat protein
MNTTRFLIVLGLGCSLLAGGFAGTKNTGPALRSEQAELARTIEVKAADECWAGNTVRAMELYRGVLRQWHALDDIHGIVRCRTAILSLLRDTGSRADQEDWLRQTREIWAAYQATSGATGAAAQEDQWRSQVLLSHSILVSALESQPADLASAGSALQEVRGAVARLPADEQRRWQIALRNLEARIRIAQGDATSAGRLLGAPLPAYAELGGDREAVREAAQCWLLAARLVSAPDRWRDAIQRYQAALDGFRSVGQVRWIQACLEEMADVCRRGGQPALAQQFQLRLEAQRRGLEPAGDVAAK